MIHTGSDNSYTVSQKTPTFLIFKQLYQKLTDFNNFWCVKF